VFTRFRGGRCCVALASLERLATRFPTRRCFVWLFFAAIDYPITGGLNFLKALREDWTMLSPSALFVAGTRTRQVPSLQSI
jgi:hypothetical protein